MRRPNHTEPNHTEEFIISVEYSQEDIWTEVLNKDLSEIDLEPFQPEEYGFVIVRHIDDLFVANQVV